MVLRVRGGRILTTHHFLLRDRLERGTGRLPGPAPAGVLPARRRHPAAGAPGHGLEDLDTWDGWLRRPARRPVRLHVPRRGRQARGRGAGPEERRLQAAASGPSRDALRGTAPVDPGDVALQEALGLHKVPETIECFDISNFQGRETVASLVYLQGRRAAESPATGASASAPSRASTISRAWSEVLDRHYGRLAEKGEPPADLVVVDGGAGQLGAARRVLARHGFADTELIGLAKREEIIVRERAEPSPAARQRGAEAAAAGARRGPPLRHHLPPAAAGPAHDRQRAGPDPRHRPDQEARPAAPLRLGGGASARPAPRSWPRCAGSRATTLWPSASTSPPGPEGRPAVALRGNRYPLGDP